MLRTGEKKSHQEQIAPKNSNRMNTKENTLDLNQPWLKPWQRRAILLLGGIAGAVVAAAALRWLDTRRSKQDGQSSEE